MFVLQPKPTFKFDVTIPAAGDSANGTIKFEFKHMGRKALKAYYETLGSGDTARADVDALGDLIVGWSGVDTAYSGEALEQLLDGFPGAATAIFEGFNKGLFEGKQKNS